MLLGVISSHWTIEYGDVNVLVQKGLDNWGGHVQLGEYPGWLEQGDLEAQVAQGLVRQAEWVGADP
nr:hypothetical protein [Calidithermus roseus]